MGHSLSLVTQSQYYSPMLNAAIFDGAVRIYFSQCQEATALKVYFRFQEILRQLSVDVEHFRRCPHTLYVMLYPTVENFERSFGSGHQSDLVEARLEEDFILGVRGPLGDETCEILFQRLSNLIIAMGAVPLEDRESLARI